MTDQQHAEGREIVELLPCPFCGGSQIAHRYVRDGTQIGCRGCGASAKPVHHGPHDDLDDRAKTAWNTRQQPQPVVAPTREDGVHEIIKPYLPLINETPALLSLLYDINMLPEQCRTRQGAVRLAGLCEAWKYTPIAAPTNGVADGELREQIARIIDPDAQGEYRRAERQHKADQILALAPDENAIRAGDWQDISTAPKDGSPILYLTAHREIGHCHWVIEEIEECEECWWDTERDEEVAPLFWMPPLPAPPKPAPLVKQETR